MERIVRMSEVTVIGRMEVVFQEVFDDDDLRITLETTSEDVEEWDSLSNVRLMIAVENEFDIRIKASEAAKLKNVGELAEFVTAKIS